jgi:hypothetical protein
MHKLKPDYKMKAFNSLFVLMMVLSTMMVTAQKADSVIVIYDNQKTVIPVPAFGSQTTVKMADSIQIIEIGVLRKRAGDNFTGAMQSADHLVRANNTEKARKQVKWFSQIEAGYTKGYTELNSQSSTTFANSEGDSIDWVTDVVMGNMNGYQLRVLLRENETMLNERISFNSGLKIGYGKSFGNGNFHTSEYDSTGYMISNTSHFSDYSLNSFQLSYEVGFGYHFSTFKLPSKITIGNGFSYSIAGTKDLNDDNSSYISTYTSILHPYIGTEIGKFGILISMDWKISDSTPGLFSNSYGYQTYNKRNRTLSIGLTFRFF